MVTALAMCKTLDVFGIGRRPVGGAFAAQPSLDPSKVKDFSEPKIGDTESPRAGLTFNPQRTGFSAAAGRILPQRPALIFLSEDPASLQLRHHLVDEIVEPGGQEREHDIETVAAKARQPLFHLVGDDPGCADKRQPAIAADALRELAHGELVARGEVDEALAGDVLAFFNP